MLTQIIVYGLAGAFIAVALLGHVLLLMTIRPNGLGGKAGAEPLGTEDLEPPATLARQGRKLAA